MSKSILYGVYTALGLMLYFLFMKILGLEANMYLRLFNGVIVIFGVYTLFKNRVNSKKPMTYFEGLAMGFMMTLTAVISFIIFLGLYIKVFDPTFIDVLENSMIWGNNLTMSKAALALFIEGMASGAIISFVSMQYFKRYTSVTKGG